MKWMENLWLKMARFFFNLTSANQPENIRYTTDGSEPTLQSNVYSKPIEVNKTMTVKAAYFENGKKQVP